MSKIRIELSKEDYDTLIEELHSLWGYHWNDDHIHADNCGSKVVSVIEENMKEINE